MEKMSKLRSFERQ